jgi:hypothetical protein
MTMQNTHHLSVVWGVLGDLITRISLLFFSFCISINIARLIKFPYSNPYSISSPHADTGFMPADNYALVVATMLLTAAIFFGLRLMLRRYATATRLTLIVVLVVMLFMGIIAPDHSRFMGNIDVFHHGEQLSPALAFFNGKHVYSDILFLHGAGEDVLLPALSFKLFGVSVGSYFFLPGLLQAVSALFFFYLLHKLIKQTAVFLLSLLWFSSTIYSSFFYVRDIFVWLAIILVYKLMVEKHTRRNTLIMYGSLGLASGLSLFYSIDRGVFLLVLNALLALALALFVGKNGSCKLAPKIEWRDKLEKLLALGGGYAAVLLSGLILLGGHAFVEFVNMSFETIPKFSGLMFYGPFPAFGAAAWLTWFPIVIAALLVVAAIKHSTWPIGLVKKEYLFAVILLIFSIVFLQAAVGMADAPHMAYATPVLFVTAFYMLSVYGPVVKTGWLQMLKFWPVMIALVLMFSPGVINLFRLPEINQVSPEFTKEFTHLTSVKDEAWLPDEVREVRDYIVTNSKPDDSLFVLSSQPIYYYLTNRNNPSRFYISWFADPQPFTDELLSDLKKNPPKLIIYQTGNYYDRPQFIPMADRLPEVNKWILDTYPVSTQVTDTVVIKSRQ